MAITKKQILEYVKNTPDNTNINVLAPMLDEYASRDNKEEINLTVTTNGTYTPEVGKTYKKVVVNVSSILEIIFPSDSGDNDHLLGSVTLEYSLLDIQTLVYNGEGVGKIGFYDPMSQRNIQILGLFMPLDPEIEIDADLSFWGADGLAYYIKIKQSETQGLYDWEFYGG